MKKYIVILCLGLVMPFASFAQELDLEPIEQQQTQSQPQPVTQWRPRTYITPTWGMLHRNINNDYLYYGKAAGVVIGFCPFAGDTNNNTRIELSTLFGLDNNKFFNASLWFTSEFGFLSDGWYFEYGICPVGYNRSHEYRSQVICGLRLGYAMPIFFGLNWCTLGFRFNAYTPWDFSDHGFISTETYLSFRF